MTTDYNDAFSRCLVELDVRGMRVLWAQARPDLPAAGSDREILISLHMARTQAKSLALRLRAYSHRWLLDHGYPSQLPDDLKPKAERMCPRVVGAVGLSVNFRAPELKPAGTAIEKVMANAVAELYADGEERPDVVKKITTEAGAKERKKLFGGD
jgi:hypothetical protein